jgi:ribosome biogenesis protein BMS1
VVCKCWINVEPKKFYHPVVDVKDWRPAKLIGQLRHEQGLAVPNNPDSEYGKQLVRAERKFNSLRIPKSLEAALPFKTKPKNDAKQSKNKMRRKTAIISSDRERQINSLLERLHVVRSEKRKLRAAASSKKKATKRVKDKFIQDKRDEHTKEAKKKRYVKEGKQEGQRRKAMRLD